MTTRTARSIRLFTTALLGLALANCGAPQASDDADLETADPAALTWVAPLSDNVIAVDDPVELVVSTQNPAAHAVRFTVDGQELAVCDPTQPEEDCHVEDLWRWTTTFTAGHHVLRAEFTDAAGQTVFTERDVDVLAQEPADNIDPGSSETEQDPTPDSELVTEGTSTVVDAISAARGYLDPSRGFHSVFGGRVWEVQGQRVVLQRGRIDGSVSAVTSCMARYGSSIKRYADLRYISRASVIATLITESNCSDPRGSSDGLSSGPMQVTSSTCSAITGLSRSTCRSRMYTSPDFSIDVGVRYMASSYQRRQHQNDPPKIAAAYNAGSIRRTSSNAWHMVSTGNHIDRWVAAYNAYRTWERQHGVR